MVHTSAWALFRSSATSLSKSPSFISVSKRSAPPSSKSFESCCFDSISLSIFSSTVPRQTNLCTKTFLVWPMRSEEHTSELQSRLHLVCRLLLEQKNVHEGVDRRRESLAYGSR